MAVRKRASEVIDGDNPIVVPGISPKDRILQWAAYRASDPTLTDGDIAKKIGISTGWLRVIKCTAVKEGWLKFENPLARIENELIPQVVENLAEFLRKKDKQVTLETAKNTIFPEYKESKGIKENATTVLALKIEAADPEDVRVLTGEIIGAPRELGE